MEVTNQPTISQSTNYPTISRSTNSLTISRSTNYPTINFNHMPGAIYWDAGAQFNVIEKGQLYIKVNNIANLLPPPAGSLFNGQIYDVIGRMYFIGFRLRL